jgi:predicted RNA-binding protein with PUA-like domain
MLCTASVKGLIFSMNYWLIKSEPEEFSIDDLKNAPGKKEHWDGIRNYQARNFIRDDMSKGDLAFFYHSNCKTPGIVGLCEIVSDAYPDHTQFDPDSRYYDAGSSPDNPRWLMRDVKYRRKTKRLISLTELKEQGEQLEDFALIRRGNRLSIMPVSEAHWNYILSLE